MNIEEGDVVLYDDDKTDRLEGVRGRFIRSYKGRSCISWYTEENGEWTSWELTENIFLNYKKGS